MAAYGWAVIDASRGFPTSKCGELERGFLHLWHGGQSPAYLLAVPEGADRPRLFETTEQTTDEARRGLAQGEESAKLHIAPRGRYRDGEWEFQNLAADERPPKAGAPAASAVGDPFGAEAPR